MSQRTILHYLPNVNRYYKYWNCVDSPQLPHSRRYTHNVGVSGQLPIYRPLIRHIKLTIGVARVIDVVNLAKSRNGSCVPVPVA